ncbi:MAG TPA: uracil-DNA glycosylase [Gammaproteobacteria bacterium]|nr:uracil-DNA glycosylase [Gammaproteobacteria bacterium]
MSAARDRYLEEIGIPVWRLRATASAATPLQAQEAPVVSGVAEAPSFSAPATSALQPGADEWSELKAKVSACMLCGLHKSRTQTVFGVGRRDAQLFVIGEAPGADEDRQGEPFVGRAGQLLNAMLRAIGLPRSEVYIANILKCRPPGNRDPQPDESSSCTPYLAQQIALVQPRVLMAVGRIAAQWLLQTDTPIGRLRGRVVPYGERNTPLVVTYHPAYLLRSPLDKAKAWTDLCKVRELLSQPS